MSTHDSHPGADDHTARPGQNPQADVDVDGMAHTRPTSPATGAAAAAAARAAYAGAEKAAGVDPTPDTGDGASVAAGAEDGSLPDAAVQGDLAGDTPTDDQPVQDPAPQGGQSDAERLAAERLADYQRLNAEYINYKRRVDRDRADDRKRATASVVESLLPVLDEIYFARQHGELTEESPFAKIAAKLESILAGHGVTMYGEVGETFDPTVHEALMHTTADLPPGTTDTTVVMVMQPGFRMGDRVIRAARVSVADPA